MQPPDLESIRLLANNAPLDDFCGLTSTEMHHLLYDTFGEKSPLQLRKEIAKETLDNILFFRLTEEYLKIIQRDGFIKLTPLGALPRKTLHELYDHRLITEYMIESGIAKLSRMKDSVSLTTLFVNTRLTGLVKTRNGKLNLTKEGEKALLPDQRYDLFKRTLGSFTGGFNWGYNDMYTEHPVGQLGWGFTVYLLFRFGDQSQTMQFYVDKYLKAFPTLIEHFTPPLYDTPHNQFTHCYTVRTFERFLDWFGFVSIEQHKSIGDRSKARLTRTEILTRTFHFE